MCCRAIHYLNRLEVHCLRLPSRRFVFKRWITVQYYTRLLLTSERKTLQKPFPRNLEGILGRTVIVYVRCNNLNPEYNQEFNKWSLRDDDLQNAVLLDTAFWKQDEASVANKIELVGIQLLEHYYFRKVWICEKFNSKHSIRRLWGAPKPVLYLIKREIMLNTQ